MPQSTQVYCPANKTRRRIAIHASPRMRGVAPAFVSSTLILLVLATGNLVFSVLRAIGVYLSAGRLPFRTTRDCLGAGAGMRSRCACKLIKDRVHRSSSFLLTATSILIVASCSCSASRSAAIMRAQSLGMRASSASSSRCSAKNDVSALIGFVPMQDALDMPSIRSHTTHLKARHGSHHDSRTTQDSRRSTRYS